MRWHVHGTDASTGRPVTLAVEHAQAMGAIKNAMSKRILVSYVTGPERLRTMIVPLTVGIAGVLLAAFALLYWQNSMTRGELGMAKAEASRLSATLRDAE